MNMGKKDLDSWGRDKAKKRYADGGSVEGGHTFARKEHPNLPAARATLGHRMRSGEPIYRGPDIPNPKWRDPVGHHPEAIPTGDKAVPYDSSKDKVKTGGRIKK